MAWFFVRIPSCHNLEAVEKFKCCMACIGYVRECGLGTRIDETAGWYVIRSRAGDVPGVRERLKFIGINDRVDMVDLLSHPTEGESLVKQLALF